MFNWDMFFGIGMLIAIAIILGRIVLIDPPDED